MSQPDEVRRNLYTWAARRGVLTDAALREAASQGGDPETVPFTDDQAEYFRTRRILRIREDSTGGSATITISTRQTIAARKVQELQQTFDARYKADGITLVVTTAPSYKIDQTVATLGPPLRFRDGRVTCGSSIGIGNQRNAGTLTALARSKKSAQLLGLSCNHVIGGCSTTVPGTPIVVPGIQDITADSASLDVVGTFTETASMRQGLPTVSDVSANGDLACFELDVRGSELLTSWHGTGDSAYDTPTEFADDVATRTLVQKWGRSTGWTSGQITTVLSEPEPVEYSVTSFFGPQASQVFKGTIYYPLVYEVGGTRRGFSAPGDSGSLVVSVEKDGRTPRVVGVIIAGGTSKTLVLPIRPMLDNWISNSSAGTPGRHVTLATRSDAGRPQSGSTAPPQPRIS